MSSVETKQPQQVGAKKSARYRITIYEAWCKRCGICVEFCPKHVLSSDQFNTPSPTNPERCVGCTQCVLHCPDFAITVSVDERTSENAED